MERSACYVALLYSGLAAVGAELCASLEELSAAGAGEILSCLGCRSGSGLLNLLGLCLLNRCRLLEYRLRNRSRSRLLILGLNRLLELRLYRLSLLNGLLVLGLILGTLVLGLNVRDLGDNNIGGLRLLGGVVIGVDTCVLAGCHYQLIADAQENVAEDGSGDKGRDTAETGYRECGNTLEYQEQCGCIVCALDNAYRQKTLAVSELADIACIRILGLGTEIQHMSENAGGNCNNCADENDQETCEINSL